MGELGAGGRAGGIKYVCGGIVFKFALDDKNLYKGDQYAMKAASHDLKGASARASLRSLACDAN